MREDFRPDRPAVATLAAVRSIEYFASSAGDEGLAMVHVRTSDLRSVLEYLYVLMPESVKPEDGVLARHAVVDAARAVWVADGFVEDGTPDGDAMFVHALADLGQALAIFERQCVGCTITDYRPNCPVHGCE